MKLFKVVLVTVLAGTISIGVAIFGQRWIDESPFFEGLSERSADPLQTLPDFRLNDLDGREIARNTWAGKVLVLNFWATWCPSCVDEIPLFIRTQDALQDAGVQFVGIAVDRVEDVRAFVAEYPLNYPILIADSEMIALSKRLGNRLEVLPFTVIFDRRGRRVHSQIGELEPEELQAQLVRLIDSRNAKL